MLGDNSTTTAAFLGVLKIMLSVEKTAVYTLG